ncbi:MAG: DNA-binding response regulator [bacterium]
MFKKSHIWIIDKDSEIYANLELHNSYEVSLCNYIQEAELLLEKKSLPFELIILDILIDNINGWDLLTKIRLNPQLKRVPIILTADSKNETLLVSGLKLGADDYICKPFNIITLNAKIEALLRRILWSEEDYKLFSTTENTIQKNKLTTREKEILQLIGLGKSNKQIAENLYLSELTVKTHLKNIFKKMQVANRTQAILTAISKGLIESNI